MEIIIPNAVIANSKIVNECGGPYEKERLKSYTFQELWKMLWIHTDTINRKIQNKRAQQWINMELQKKKGGERGTLGTGRITTTRRQKADPKKVAQGGMQQFLRRS